ncbi:MAG: vitamin K epoxide reductase family protein, partial [Gemmatimonadetes bacterium]|nr:vitamin K epoxide reductase family protein [Gemmatimonadota bacterium]
MSYDKRMRGIVLIGLVGLFVAVYLLLYQMGFYGALLCGAGSCELVQASKYARFLGQPVPLWGTLWYAGV